MVVSLTKDAPSLSLEKGAVAGGEMRVNLNWKQGRRGLFGGGAVDLDLACLYELQDGSKGTIQALGNAFDLQHGLIRLHGDDRSGVAAAGENLTVDLRRIDAIKRILVYTFIYEGTPNWASAEAVVTLFPHAAPPVEIRLDEYSGSRMCAIAMLENQGGSLAVHRLVRHINGMQQELDREYKWGLTWSAGRK